MEKTKKEHYVPQFYLKNFSNEFDGINVFDKLKEETRLNQPIRNIAAENGFYDIKLKQILESLGEDKRLKAQQDLAKIISDNDVDKFIDSIETEQHVEKNFLCNMETDFSLILKKVMDRADQANNWCKKNCFAITQEEKDLLSIFVAIQVIRTRSHRNSIEKIFQEIGSQVIKVMNKTVEGSQVDHDFEVLINKDYLGLQQVAMMMNPDFVTELAEIFNKHIWVLLINTTTIPFVTSDNPIARIPHKGNQYTVYSGFASEGIEISYPISSKYLINMYDSKAFAEFLSSDRKYLEIFDEEEVIRFNKAQKHCCNRFVYAGTDDISSIID